MTKLVIIPCMYSTKMRPSKHVINVPQLIATSSSCPQYICGRNGSEHCINEISFPVHPNIPLYTRPVPPEYVWSTRVRPSPSPIEWQVTLASWSVQLRKGSHQGSFWSWAQPMRDDVAMGSVNERRRYDVTSSLIGWAHTQNVYYVFRYVTLYYTIILNVNWCCLFSDR